MSWQLWVLLIWVLTGAIGIAVFDVWLLHRYGLQGTVSWQLLHFGRQYPIVPYLIGYVTGFFAAHIWWSQIAQP